MKTVLLAIVMVMGTALGETIYVRRLEAEREVAGVAQ